MYFWFLNLVETNTSNLGLHLYEEVSVLTLAVEVSGSSWMCWLVAPFLWSACPHAKEIFIFDLPVVFSFPLLWSDLISTQSSALLAPTKRSDLHGGQRLPPVCPHEEIWSPRRGFPTKRSDLISVFLVIGLWAELGLSVFLVSGPLWHVFIGLNNSCGPCLPDGICVLHSLKTHVFFQCFNSCVS